MNLLAEVLAVNFVRSASAPDCINVLLVNRPEHWDFSRLGDWLYRERRRELSICDVVVVRQPPDKFENVSDKGADKGSDMKRRIPDKPIYLLGASKGVHILGKNLNPNTLGVLDSINTPMFLRQLCQSELANIARRTKAILSAKPTRIFRAPSKMFADHFLRAGNVQKSRAVLDAFFFWLIPHISGSSALLTETWSISTLGQHAGRLLSKGRKSADCVTVDMLNRYHDGSPSAEKYIQDIVDRLTHFRTGTLTVIVSAAVSYGSLKRLVKTVDDNVHHGWEVRWVLLFRLADEEPPQGIHVLCDLHDIPEPQAYKPIKECPLGRDIVDIDPTTYFPVSSIRETYIAIAAAHARGAKTFFENYSGGGVFSLHRDNYVGGGRFRHHAIYSDVIQLLAHERFARNFREKLLSLDAPPTHIVTPPHEAGLAMAEAAVKIYRDSGKATPRIWNHISLDFSLDSGLDCIDLRLWLQSATQDEALLILDDVAVTGERLGKYQRSLRAILANGVRKQFRGQIHYLVGLARPARQEVWSELERRHSYRGGNLPKHSVNCVEKLILPDWQEGDCPWCQELEILRALGKESSQWPTKIAKRMRELTDVPIEKSPLRYSDAFLRPQSSEPAADPLHLRGGSIFGPEGMNDIEVFVSVASALQELRNQSGTGMHGFPSVHLLKVEDYLGAQFSESILRASLVRAARRQELESLHASEEEKRSHFLTKAILDPPHNECIALELCVSSAMYKLPWPKLSTLQLQSITNRGYGEELTAFIQRYKR